jgi:hypothetical protein
VIATALLSLRRERISSLSRMPSISIRNNKASAIRSWLLTLMLKTEIRKWTIQTVAIVTISEVFVMKEKR